MVEVNIKTPIYPTESTKRVKEVVKNLFLDLEVSIEDSEKKKMLKAQGNQEQIDYLRQKILEQKISDTARSIISENNLCFSLNKQAATVGEINFKQDGPLGVIEVEILGDRNTIDYLAPKTKDGEPIE
ncbi:hypothetical protein C9439_05255 [archaeon SCG-AAA382B04]|nr:hypothetical protein C9439_05255 [archaeon SCG-AAA382B04]